MGKISNEEFDEAMESWIERHKSESIQSPLEVIKEAVRSTIHGTAGVEKGT